MLSWAYDDQSHKCSSVVIAVTFLWTLTLVNDCSQFWDVIFPLSLTLDLCLLRVTSPFLRRYSKQMRCVIFHDLKCRKQLQTDSHPSEIRLYSTVLLTLQSRPCLASSDMQTLSLEISMVLRYFWNFLHAFENRLQKNAICKYELQLDKALIAGATRILGLGNWVMGQ